MRRASCFANKRATVGINKPLMTKWGDYHHQWPDSLLVYIPELMNIYYIFSKAMN